MKITLKPLVVFYTRNEKDGEELGRELICSFKSVVLKLVSWFSFRNLIPVRRSSTVLSCAEILSHFHSFHPNNKFEWFGHRQLLDDLACNYSSKVAIM